MTLKLTPVLRAHMLQNRSLSRDGEGHEILVGLSRAESIAYLNLIFLSARTEFEELELEKLWRVHASARAEVVAAEAMLRLRAQTIH